MSTPTDPTGSGSPESNANPNDRVTPDAQPTEAYPTDAHPTEAYPPAPPAPPAADATAAYGVAPAAHQATAPEAPYGQAPYGQAPYGQAPYGQAPYGSPAQSDPDTRPKTLAWISLALAVVGTLVACIGFVPLGWAGIVAVIIGGVLLLAGFVLSIVALASRKQGGKPIGITALIVSVLGGIVWSIAFFVALAVGILSSAVSDAESAPAPQVSEAPLEGEDGTDAEGEVSGDYDEEAFLAEARPAITELFTGIDPSITEDFVTEMFPDEALVTVGQAFLMVGEDGRDQMLESLIAGSEGVFDEETAGRFADIMIDAAEKHLQ